MPYSVDYATLLSLSIDIVQSQAGSTIAPGDEWMNDAQTLSIKLFRHLVSMQTLSAGATVDHNNDQIVFVDHASVKVVARAALETYLVFFYIYGSSHELAKFRHKTWHLGGLTDRQRSHASKDEHKEQLAAEKREIENLKFEIEAMPQFQIYSSKQQAQLLKGEWKVGISWTDLGIEAGFHDKYFKNIYSYLCGYSHSSYISALQVGQADSVDTQKSLTQAILGIGVVIMAHYAFTYSRVFKRAEEILSANSEAKRIAEKWRLGPNDMAPIYDR
jgi:hypothetical protein